MKLVRMERLAEATGKSMYTLNARRKIMQMNLYSKSGRYVSSEDYMKLLEYYKTEGCVTEADAEIGELHTEEEVLDKFVCRRSLLKYYCARSRVTRGWCVNKIRHYTDEEIRKIGDAMRRKPFAGRRRRPVWYKVAVFDRILCGWVVRHCSLTRDKAESMVDEYASCGEMARCSPHIRTAAC